MFLLIYHQRTPFMYSKKSRRPMECLGNKNAQPTNGHIPSEPPALMPAMSAAQPARAVVSPTMFTQLFEALKRGGWMDRKFHVVNKKSCGKNGEILK